MDIPPGPTIYINNLYEKLTKDELKKGLYAMFSQFGKIVDVVALKTLKLRGQAWVVFTDTAAATNALRTMQGFPFFDKPVRISYAKTESDAIAKLKGTYKPDLKKKKHDDKATTKDQPGKKTKTAAVTSTRGPQGPAELAPPNKTLFVQGLPEATTDQMLQMLFAQFPGFKEVRMIEARPGIAFVDFENEMQSGVAQQGLQNFNITPQHAMAITFAKQ
mmetsp:Transcript_18075/g.30948  ORF Transcript_18075/g.30948 Transcript_18075/m.30948 type:complete len:218 (+) Transcript_18075:115-768(+)|eukprot:CAMPEP_0119109398 /NCGR_PEP_ID=MMETSP1180-20130426/17890_1 /TAXON_ID=3052 ORGANISM="Chlamydomonas cf sp, Strain CCMP681" /NCGR_SAMPLE_ID=MMETSP1180 /ASSEMBLY_ACC=CAM_ASM_000741 /LENGTH=217 /DNA_ID=CAMNT_0007095153 /DNA_START=96 /DNA_END=749 /DNA_ORIENTATION=-